MNRATAAALAALAAALLASLPFWANDGIVFRVGVALVGALFALSWNLLFGFAGLATFGHAGFFAMGAYLVALALKADPAAPFLLLLVGCAAIGAVSAALIGLVALKRTGGVQLAILTLAVSEILYLGINTSAALGGADGLSAIPRPRLGFGLFAIDLTRTAAYYWFLLVVCAVLAAALWWVVESRFGRVLRCIRQDPERAAFLGVDVAGYRLWAFMLSGAVAAIAGGLSAPWTQIVTPAVASWTQSVQPMLNALLGGASFFWGPVVGTVLFSVIEFSTRTLAGLSEIVVGLVLMVVVLAAPGGLLGYLAGLKRRFAAAPRPKPAPAALDPRPAEGRAA